MNKSLEDDAVKEIILDNTLIKLNHYEEQKVNGLHQISIVFNVTSEEYHDIATLLYKGTFEVTVPDSLLFFRATITKYSTSITNLYERGQVGEYKLSLMETEI
ncbi:Protein of unknown function [Psychrobacillus sp. OK028]|uniref:DUF3219 family protein n=1 Tax=Psychrobacillus sp. OK028 TaxID=1884359 RepID=UPI000883F32A|nr:DUF3219 family protein [Psychrobacillus sp. OK028]SDO01649.1 Protein of unknown function [Psychrobacillus sp. OK028]